MACGKSPSTWGSVLFALTREGEVGAGNEIRLNHSRFKHHRGLGNYSVVCKKGYGDADAARVWRALRVAVLTESWKGYFASGWRKFPL